MASEQSESRVRGAFRGVESSVHQVTDRAMHVRESAEHYTQEAPLTATLVSFGIGMGLGLLLAQMLVPPARSRRRPHWYDNYLGESRARHLEDSLGHAAHRYLPRAVKRRLGV